MACSTRQRLQRLAAVQTRLANTSLPPGPTTNGNPSLGAKANRCQHAATVRKHSDWFKERKPQLVTAVKLLLLTKRSVAREGMTIGENCSKDDASCMGRVTRGLNLHLSCPVAMLQKRIGTFFLVGKNSGKKGAEAAGQLGHVYTPGSIWIPSASICAMAAAVAAAARLEFGLQSVRCLWSLPCSRLVLSWSRLLSDELIGQLLSH